MEQKMISDIIRRLKAVREDNGLSCQKIVEMVEQRGQYVSLSTVRRVFEDGSETYGFQYANTLKPIADAVLGVYEPSKPDAITVDEVDALKAIVAYNSEKIKAMSAQLEETREQYEERIAFLKQQISLKDERIDKRDMMIEKLLDALPICRQKGCESCVCPARIETE